MIFVGVTLSSCSYQLWLKPKYFTYLYDEKSTKLDSLINLIGYYRSEIIIPKQVVTSTNGYTSKSYIELFLFYKNGTVASMSTSDLDGILSNNSSSYSWGIYKISNDTIKSQIITDFGPMMSPGVFDRRFIIMSDTTLRMIYEKELGLESPPNKLKGNEFYYFHSYPNRIDSTSNPYLKKKWFWDKKVWKKQKKD